MIHQHNPLVIENARLRRMATYAALGIAAILIIAKIVAYMMTDSVAILSSLFDSIFDLVSSSVTAFGVASALRPPDHNHRYGHGKAEPLAALAQSIFVIGSSMLLLYEAANRLMHPSPVTHELVGYIVMGVAIILTAGLVIVQNRVVRATHSVAIGADKLHYAGDIAINLAVVFAFILHQTTGYDWFDPLFAACIAIGLMVSAFYILKSALGALMDAELSDTEREKIKQVVLQQPGVFGVHDMRTRSDSDRVFIEMHVEMDGKISLLASHELSERIISAIQKTLPYADIVIHQDPVGIKEETRDRQIEKQWAQ